MEKRKTLENYIEYFQRKNNDGSKFLIIYPYMLPVSFQSAEIYFRLE